MIHKLTEMVMSNVGLDVNSEFKVVDQDFGDVLIYEDKFIKCSYNNQEPYININDIKFEPINNIKQMSFLFIYFLQKMYSMTSLYIASYCQISNNNKETALEIKGDRHIISNFYKSDTLKYVDIIFRLSGYPDVSFLKDYDNQVR